MGILVQFLWQDISFATLSHSVSPLSSAQSSQGWSSPKRTGLPSRGRGPSGGGRLGLPALAYKNSPQFPQWWWEFLLRGKQNLKAIDSVITIKNPSCGSELPICCINFFGPFANILVCPEKALLWGCCGSVWPCDMETSSVKYLGLSAFRPASVCKPWGRTLNTQSSIS